LKVDNQSPVSAALPPGNHAWRLDLPVDSKVYRGAVSTYRISQFARRTGVQPSTLRFYEQAGLLPAQRSEAGYRLYDDQAIERLAFISLGKRLGLPLDEIRDLLPVWEGGLCADVRTRLRPMLLAHIDDTDRRREELDAFADRLRAALAEIDGPPRPGRCDPGCGFLRDYEPAPVELTLQPPIACTLTGTDQRERVRQWRDLLDGADREVMDGGLRWHLPVQLAGQVAELAAAEQQCCTFFDFALYVSVDGLRFEARAPEHAVAVLAHVFGD
jgi:DNA-binding transcriptional MerR regulator